MSSNTYMIKFADAVFRQTGSWYFRGSSSAPFATFRLNRQHTKAFAGNLAVTLVSGTDTKYRDM
jgi:hypothetical protein